MSKTVVAIFEERDFAEKAARDIKNQGLRTDDISLLARERERDSEGITSSMMGNGMEGVNDNISDGVIGGGVLGGIAGLLLGAGSMMVPGLGIIAAAGPITGLISGAVTGGVVGGLVDLGIPENRGKQYEANIKAGNTLFSMKTEEDKVDKIALILRNNGAISVDTY